MLPAPLPFCCCMGKKKAFCEGNFMHRNTKRLASALLAAALCLLLVPQAGADYEPWTYEVDDVMSTYGVEYYADVGFENPTRTADQTAAGAGASGGISTYSTGAGHRAAVQIVPDGTEVAVQAADTGKAVDADISVYSAGGFTVYSAGTKDISGDYYKVTIPTEVVVDTTTNKGTLSISSSLTMCSNLVVTIASASTVEENGTSKYYLTCEGGTEKLEYKMAHNAVVFSKDNTETGTVTQEQNIDIRVLGTPIVSGVYQDTLTFTMDPKEFTTDTTKHTLTFDANATSKTTITDDVVTISTKSKVITTGEEYGPLPTPHRDGFEFDGWYTQETGGEQVYATTVAEDADATVYAHWTPHKLTIKYHNDGADKIQWEVDPSVDRQGARLNQDQTDYQGYELIYQDDTKQKITGLKLTSPSAGDVTLVEIEEYGGTFTNGPDGLFNTSRWRKGSNYGLYGKWALSSGGTALIGDGGNFETGIPSNSAQAIAAYVDKVADTSYLQQLKEGDVVLDLYPVWSASKASADSDETADDTDILLPTWDEKTPVVVDKTTTTDSTADAANEDETTALLPDVDTVKPVVVFDGSTAAPETTPAADTTPDDLRIMDADEMLAEFALQDAQPVW